MNVALMQAGRGKNTRNNLWKKTRALMNVGGGPDLGRDIVLEGRKLWGWGDGDGAHNRKEWQEIVKQAKAL